MAEIKRVYLQNLPKIKLVGRFYGDSDKVDGTFAARWGEWFANDWFSPLKFPSEGEPFEDCDAYIGLCRCKDGVMWCFERYVCPRFTVPDDKGNVILDMCFYVK